MSTFLDKSITFSVRQIWRWTRRTMYLLIPIYLVMFFLKGWEVKMGGVSLQRSPFADRVPSECRAYADRFGGNSIYAANSRSNLSDAVLLRGRVIESDIEPLLNGTDYASKCFGYAVLNGLHGLEAGNANLIERWIDKDGKAVLSVQVQYHQTLRDLKSETKREITK